MGYARNHVQVMPFSTEHLPERPNHESGFDRQRQVSLELVSKELDHFGVIAGLFRQIGGHSSRFVLFCSF